MKKLFAVALLALSSLSAAAALVSPAAGAADAKPSALAVGAVAPDFTLPDADGKQHSLASLKGKSGTVIIFVATKCPVSNAYTARMQKLADDYRARGVNVVGINSTASEPAAEVKSHAAEKGLAFTILKDAGHVVADRLDAQVTPEAYFLDAA
ncbi:MAG TPA: redoxin domain-containing protein, partial [Pyrinomonadaceae bacterium]|nr:redoxin domain-containing protein [Pyrinomonadaceae bacterium]